jgi:hypothetical protein
MMDTLQKFVLSADSSELHSFGGVWKENVRCSPLLVPCQQLFMFIYLWIRFTFLCVLYN